MNPLIGISTFLVSLANPTSCRSSYESTREGTGNKGNDQKNTQQQPNSDDSYVKADGSVDDKYQVSFRNDYEISSGDEKSIKMHFSETAKNSGSNTLEDGASKVYETTYPLKLPFRTVDKNQKSAFTNVHADQAKCSDRLLTQPTDEELYGRTTPLTRNLGANATACASPKRIQKLKKHSSKNNMHESPTTCMKNTSVDDFIKQLVKSHFDSSKPFELFDAAVVYDKRDDDEVNQFITAVRSTVKAELGEDLKIELYDNEMFCESLVKVTEDVFNRISVVLVYLTNNTISESFRLLCEEIICLKCQNLNNSNSYPNGKINERQWILKPVHTQSTNRRTYKVPVGLASANGIDWYDKNSEHTRNRILSVMQEAIRRRKRSEEEQDVSLAYASVFGRYNQTKKSQSFLNLRSGTSGEDISGGSHTVHPTLPCSVNETSASLFTLKPDGFNVTGKPIIKPNVSRNDLNIASALSDTKLKISQQTTKTTGQHSSKCSNCKRFQTGDVLSDSASDKSESDENDLELLQEFDRIRKTEPIVLNIIGSKHVQIGLKNTLLSSSNKLRNMKSPDSENDISNLKTKSGCPNASLERDQIERNIPMNINKQTKKAVPDNNDAQTACLLCNLEFPSQFKVVG